MARWLRTDDQGKRFSYKWYGPVELAFLWFWNARMSIQLYTLGLTIALWAFMGLLIPSFLFEPAPIPAALAKGLTVFVVAPAIAVGITVLAAPHISHETPLRYQAQMLASELKAPRPTSRERRPMQAVHPQADLFTRPQRRATHLIDPSVLTRGKK